MNDSKQNTSQSGRRRETRSSGGFRLYDDAIALVRMLAPLWREVGKHNRRLKQQLEDAACSVPANVQEGRCRWNGHGRNRLETAMQSARECIGHLETAEAAGYLTREDIAAAVDHADKVVATAWKCLYRTRR